METVIILIACGALLLLLETVLPGLVAGVLGVLCLMAAVIVGYIRFDLVTANWIAGGVMTGVVLGAGLWCRYFPGSRMAKQFISNKAVGGAPEGRSELINRTGVAHTTLRPSGTALIDGRRVDVVTEGGMVDPGQPVKVVAVEGVRVVVRPV
ncbi:MAG: hypothetical protein FJ404_17000 [Verrucomicrobia bacterium]|nr:hypothetical protein [Verrucomicrobiota bacterium]